MARAPTRDDEGRCAHHAQRPQPARKKNYEQQKNIQQQRQRPATSPVMRIVTRTGKVRDTLVSLSFDTAALARSTGKAKHAEATSRLLNAIGEVWHAGEALAESQEMRR